MTLDLCGFENHSIVIINPMSHLLKVEDDKRVIGLFGECIDRMLCSIEKRKCRVIGQLGLGVKSENGTYTGILGMLQSKQVDMYFKPEQEYLNEDWLYRTEPFHDEKILVIQPISSMKAVQFDLIENFKFEYQIILSYIGCWLFLVLMCSLLARTKNYVQTGTIRLNRMGFISRIGYLYNSFFSKKQFKIMLSSIILFIWFTRIIILNSIKTNKVVVDTSQLIQTHDKLMKSKRTACFLNKETEMNLALTSPKNSTLYRLFAEKTMLPKDQFELIATIQNNRCVVRLKPGFASLIDEKVLIISSKMESDFLLFFFSEINPIKTYWIMRKGVQDLKKVLYFNLRNKINQIYFPELTRKKIEAGIFELFFKCVKTNTSTQYTRIIDVFEMTKDFLNARIKFDNLAIQNFRLVFLAYFILMTLYTFFFTVTYLQMSSRLLLC